MKWKRLGTVLIVFAVAALAVRIWLGYRDLVEQERKTAELKAAADKARVEAEKARVEAEKHRASEPYTLKFLNIQLAYGKAELKLGRPPKSAEELKPFLSNPEDLLSPRDQQPFEVGWGVPVLRGAPLRIWEAKPDEAGGRFVSVKEGVVIAARYVTAEEFAELAGKGR